MNICCIDFDNVGVFGITKALELDKDIHFNDYIIVGKHLEKVRISTHILVEISKLSMQNRCKLHFHNKDIKNSSDFLLCYYIGVYDEMHKQSQNQEQDIVFHIISGDTSFISLEEIHDITIVIHNIHLPQEVLDKIHMERLCNIETDSVLSSYQETCRENKEIHTSIFNPIPINDNNDDLIKKFIMKQKSTFPINIKQLVKKIREHFGKKYHSKLGQDKSLSRIKALKMYIKSSSYLSYEKRTNIVSFI